jgi:ketosteroid isomerase-like protein
LPYQGVTKGADEVARQVFAAIPTTYERLAFTPERLLGSGDTVAVLGTGTAVGPGGEHRFRFAHVVELRRGRVVRMNGFADTHRLALALARA